MLKESKNSIIKTFFIGFFVLLCFSCKQQNNMEGLIAEYNKMFIPSEDLLWTVENIEKSTTSFEDFELEKEYTVSKDAGLFIIGGPRECKQYTWVLSGNGIQRPCGDQIFKIRIKVTNTDIDTGVITNTGSLPVGTYDLRLECISKDGIQGNWETKLKVE